MFRVSRGLGALSAAGILVSGFIRGIAFFSLAGSARSFHYGR